MIAYCLHTHLARRHAFACHNGSALYASQVGVADFLRGACRTAAEEVSATPNLALCARQLLDPHAIMGDFSGFRSVPA
jgi:hypothetical protein